MPFFLAKHRITLVVKEENTRSEPAEISEPIGDSFDDLDIVVDAFDRTVGHLFMCRWVKVKRVHDLVLQVDECLPDLFELLGLSTSEHSDELIDECLGVLVEQQKKQYTEFA